MSGGAGYDVVVDIDDEVRSKTGQLIIHTTLLYIFKKVHDADRISYS